MRAKIFVFLFGTMAVVFSILGALAISDHPQQASAWLLGAILLTLWEDQEAREVREQERAEEQYPEAFGRN